MEKSKATGNFEVASIEVGDYKVTVSASGKNAVVDEITIITGTPL